MKSACGLVILLLLIRAPALAQETFDEGRPARAVLTLAPDAEHPVALLRLEGVVGAAPRPSWRGGVGALKRRSAQARRVRAVSLSPHLPGEVVTLDLIASEDLSLSAVARAPLPDAHANLEGRAFVRCRLLAPGEVVNVTVSFVPTVAPQRSLLAWRGVVLDPLRAQGQVFARGPGASWTPGAERPEDPAGHLELGGPPKAHGPAFGLPRTALRVHLTRWIPWTGGKPTRDVLLAERALGFEGALSSDLGGGEQRVSLAVKPAAFGLAAARAKAKLRGEGRAVRLKDDRWVLGGGGRWWVVGATGEVIRGAGEVFPFALDLAREGRAGFLWFAYGDHPELASALREQGFSPQGGGKALGIEVKEASLVPFLKLLEAHAARLTPSGIKVKE